jgi:two-component system, sensor histidine kinase and response regulator
VAADDSANLDVSNRVAPTAPRRADASADSSGAPVPVLIVDDNAAKRLALKSVLLPLGYVIVEADSGQAALRCVMVQDFAVILLDVRMPIMGGFETAELIRLRQQSEMTPIIFITAHGADEIVTERYSKGAVDFLFAPVRPDELRAKVSFFANLFLKAELLAAQARQVRASADQLRMLTDAAPVGIFQTDAQNRYVYTNPLWSRITGVPADEAVGRRWDSILRPDQRASLASELRSAVVFPAELSHRFEISVPHSPPRIVLVTSNRMLGKDGAITGWVGTLADVTAEAGAEAAMSDARDEATMASRLKSDFLANMSHEIRTPMNGVLGMTDLLLETELDAAQRDYAQTVRSSGEALLTIIDDILDFSKIEAGRLDIEDIEFNLRAVIEGVEDLLARSVQAKGLELVVVVDRTVPAVIGGDPGRIRQVLTNLIGNAIKFTASGEIVVRVTQLWLVGADTVIQFEVSDTGVGISPDKLDLVFAPFVQADTSTSRRYGGTGLGLAITSQLVAAMGGDCGVSSVLGEGSTFSFTIRVHAEAGQVASELFSPYADLAGVTALVVDDNAAQRGVLSDLLTDWGMVVSTADSGLAGLATLRAAATGGQPFAVALVDQSMPGMDGLDLANAVVADPDLAPGLVLMTELGHDVRGDDAGNSEWSCVSKPVHRADLRSRLQLALGLAADDVPATATHPPTPVIGAQRGRNGLLMGRLLLAEDNLINQKVAVAMLSGAGYRVDTVLNGAAAVLAVANQPYDAILMDCQMPELNGYEATAAIRAQEGSSRHTPIIAMTAGARREDRERCLAEGMDSYLAKPVSKDVLLAMVARTVGTGSKTPSSATRSVHTMSAENPIDQAVFDELRLLGEATERDFVTKLVDHFIFQTDLLIAQLHDASSRGDDFAVSRIAHNLKGSSGQLGGRRLALSCGRLERRSVAGGPSIRAIDLDEVEADYRELRAILSQQQPQHASAEREPGDLVA